MNNPNSIREASSINFVYNNYNDLSSIKNTTYVDFKDKNLGNVAFVKDNSMPAFGEHLTAKYYVDQAFSNAAHGSPLIRLDPDEKLQLV